MKTFLLTITYLFWPLLLLPFAPLAAGMLMVYWICFQPIMLLIILGLIGVGPTDTEVWARQRASAEARGRTPVYYRQGHNKAVETKSPTIS